MNERREVIAPKKKKKLVISQNPNIYWVASSDHRQQREAQNLGHGEKDKIKFTRWQCCGIKSQKQCNPQGQSVSSFLCFYEMDKLIRQLT